MAHTILVLDDDKHVRESLVMQLEDEGFTVFEAASAEDALALLTTNPLDLVVVDLRLPGMYGTEFIDVARVQWCDLKFIIYTGSPEFRIPAELAGESAISNAVFLKPLSDCESLISEIRRMLG